MTAFDDLQERFTWFHNQYKLVIAGLPQAALDWTPGSEMNSLCVLVVHVAAAERYWVGDIGMGEPSGRIRAEEFSAQGLSEAELIARLDASAAYTRAALARLTLDDLAQPRPLPNPNIRPDRADAREFTLGWALLHALEHAALHLGHAQLTRQLWEQRQT